MSPSFLNAIKALSELGIQPVALNALYRFGLVTGHYQRVTCVKTPDRTSSLKTLLRLPGQAELAAVLGKDGRAALLAEADEIVAGKVRLFGSDPVPLQLTIVGELADWTAYETGRVPYPIDQVPVGDVKFLWEPARFGWAFVLGRAYHLTGEAKYAETFWRYFELFTDGNPACRGPHWTSAQEVALRLMALVWSFQVFAPAPISTPERLARLAGSVAAHASRIPPTLPYARSQQNNHLLSEATGLLTAGLALPDHPLASRWRSLGWKWLNEGLRSQIDGYGEYAQHSTNYHRLMLQLVLWTNALIQNTDSGQTYRWPHPTKDAVTRSIHWLLALQDAETGRVPNLGANDGAYIFPFSTAPFEDYRPVLQAAARAFLEYDLPHGPWDEVSLWFGIPIEYRKYVQLPRYLGDQLYGKESWAYLRTAQFNTRPSHADQLHVDLWWRGQNMAQDAGTYLYNAPPPWDNSLTTALVHNTVVVNGRDQMTRAGRFLYLDWVNAYRRGGLEADPDILQQVRGRFWNFRLAYRHTRRAAAFINGNWRITDELLPLRWLFTYPIARPSLYRLHWLLPDWKWKLEKRESGVDLHLDSPCGPVVLSIGCSPFAAAGSFSLVRAGELLGGTGEPDPIRGWVSPTYGVKLPALSLAVETKSSNEVQFISEFIFP
jgi:hypothetical protein